MWCLNATADGAIQEWLGLLQLGREAGLSRTSPLPPAPLTCASHPKVVNRPSTRCKQYPVVPIYFWSRRQIEHPAARLHSSHLTDRSSLRRTGATIRKVLVMAITDDVPGLQVEVIVDGQPLWEYDDDEDEAERFTTTKYIEAMSDKPFSIRVVYKKPFPRQYGVEMDVKIDGGQGRGRMHKPEDLYRPEGHRKSSVSFHKGGQRFRRKYRFVALDIGNSDCFWHSSAY
jgi:hypothetical protein